MLFTGEEVVSWFRQNDTTGECGIEGYRLFAKYPSRPDSVELVVNQGIGSAFNDCESTSQGNGNRNNNNDCQQNNQPVLQNNGSTSQYDPEFRFVARDRVNYLVDDFYYQPTLDSNPGLPFILYDMYIGAVSVGGGTKYRPFTFKLIVCENEVIEIVGPTQYRFTADFGQTTW